MTKRAKIAYKKGYRATKDGRVTGLIVDFMSLYEDNRGYLRFKISGLETCPVHRLVAYQKFGDAIYQDSVEVRHLNGNPIDNNWDNIVLGTHSENMLDRPERDRKAHALKAGRGRSNLSKEDVERIRHLRGDLGWKYSRILNEYPMAKSTLSYICNYKTWKD